MTAKGLRRGAHFRLLLGLLGATSARAACPPDWVAAAPPPSDTGRVALVIRAHRVTRHLLDSITRYTEELRGTPGSLYFSVDATGPEGRALVRVLHAAGFGNVLHVHDDASTMADYPATYAELMPFLRHEQLKRSQIGLNSTRKFAYAFHAESLASWFVWARTRISFSFAWHVEQDTGFSGHLAGFLGNFANDNSDFIGQNPSGLMGWSHRRAATRGFHTFFPREKQLHGMEWTLRFSRRYLAELQGLLTQRNVSAWSEMFFYTLAAAHPCTQFNRTVAGELFSNGLPMRPYSAAEWQSSRLRDARREGVKKRCCASDARVRDTGPRPPPDSCRHFVGRVYHPIKF
jgi:hypothetical protein